MARVCDICGKTKKSGNIVTFSHRAIKRSWTPNLRRVRVYDENGTPKRMMVCTNCLRSGRVNRTNPKSQAAFLESLKEENRPEEQTVVEETTQTEE